jgi:hypothetical protein
LFTSIGYSLKNIINKNIQACQQYNEKFFPPTKLRLLIPGSHRITFQYDTKASAFKKLANIIPDTSPDAGFSNVFKNIFQPEKPLFNKRTAMENNFKY